MNGGRHIVERGLQGESRGRLGNDFRGERPDGVHAQYFTIFRFGDDFDEAFVLAQNSGFAIAEKRETFPSSRRRPASRACFSVRPTEPICGSQ